jgi:hypothetical protein
MPLAASRRAQLISFIGRPNPIIQQIAQKRQNPLISCSF